MTVLSTLDIAAFQAYMEKVFATVNPERLTNCTSEGILLLLRAWQENHPERTAKMLLLGLLTSQAGLPADYEESSRFTCSQALSNAAKRDEQEIQDISNQFSAAIKANGAVEGYLKVSEIVQALPRLSARVQVFQEFSKLLTAVYNATDSMKLALEATRAEAVYRLINFATIDSSPEVVGSIQALQMVTKYLDEYR